MPTTFIDRAMTNEVVYEKATQAAHETKKKGAEHTHVERVIDLLKKRKLTLPGHIIRSQGYDKKDPIFHATFETEDFRKKTAAKRRAGNQKKHGH